jgi:hypothetical protein
MVFTDKKWFLPQKEWAMAELLLLLSLLAVRHMGRKHIRTMSKNADNEDLLEELSALHPCFIDIFAVVYLLFAF